MRIVFEILRVDLALYFRNWIAVFWTFAFPFLMLFILMAAFGESRGQFGSILVIVDDRDQTAQSQSYLKGVEQILAQIDSVAFQFVDAPSDNSRRRNAIHLNIPSGFGALVDAHKPAQVTGALSGDDPGLLKVAESIVAAVNDRLNIVRGRSPELISLSLREPVARKGLSFAQYLVTGIIVMATFSTCLFGFTLPIVSYRENGYLKILGVLPIGKMPFIASFVASRVVIAVVYAGLFFLCAKLLYHVQFVGTATAWLSFSLLYAAGVVTFLAIGFAVAVVSPTQNAATVICNLLYFSMIFLGNLFIPTRNLPHSLDAAVSLSPINSLVSGLRAALFEGVPVSGQGSRFLLLGAWLLVAVMIATIVQRMHRPLRSASRTLKALARRPG